MSNDVSTASWQAAIDSDDLWEDEMTGVTVGETDVLLVNQEGEVYAFENRCAHQEWALSDGLLEDGTITCVRHSWQFDARTGAGQNPTGCQLRAFGCKVEDGVILVELPGQ